MKTRLVSLLALVLCMGIAIPSFAQTLKGTVYDAKTDETLVGVNISYKDKNGKVKTALSDENGYYEMPIADGSWMIIFTYMGYETIANPVVIAKGQTETLNIYMNQQTNLLDAVVVSVGRYEQKVSEVTVSMEVMKPDDIVKQNATDLSVAINTLPGVDVTDKQPSIRGGSGWTYGVGSRTQVLVDGMSVLAPGVGEVNWNIVPMENVAQVEVIKGASSVLYGSSALNGLINVRTARPSIEPQTNINAYLGVYGDPQNKDYVWWGEEFWKEGKFNVTPLLRRNVLYGIRQPIYNGIDFSHTRRIGDVDVSVGMDLFTNEGYRVDNYNQRVRIGGNITYHVPNKPGMSFGLNANFLSNDYSGFFIWRSADEPYVQSPMTNMSRQGNAFYIDPFFNYYDTDREMSHKVKARFYHKSDGITSHSTSKTATQIFDQMNFDMEKLPELMNLVQNPDLLINDLMQFVPDLLNNNADGLANYFKVNIGDKYFPGATSPDYVDLLSFVMGRMPFPQNQSEAVSWLLHINEPKDRSTPPDNTTSYFLDYQFNKKYNTAQFTAGLTFDHLYNQSTVSGLHESDNIAAYFQYDQKFFEKLNVSAGMRLEYYRVDSLYREAEMNVLGLNVPFTPVFRFGLNYELTPYTFLRASFGQGYRYPSITEKFVFKDIGGIAAYPNKDLKPESGYNAEIGLKQGYKIGNFMGYLDVAGFYTRYNDMIEFQFGLFNSETFDYMNSLWDVIAMVTAGDMPGLGTRFANVSRAQIYGVDASVMGIWKINPTMQMSYNVGYTFIEPIDMDWEEKAQHQSTDPLDFKEKSNDSKYLKYRQKHSFKAVMDFEWNRFTIGTNMCYKSKTLAVDYFLVDERPKDHMDIMDAVRSIIFPGLHNYWEDHNTGYFAMDARVGVEISKKIKMWFIVNNLLNTEYTLRPMDVSQPRTFVFQVNAKI